MTRIGWLVVGATVLIVALGAGVFAWMHHRTPAPAPVVTVATSTPTPDPSTLAIYTSGEYGFSFIYPSSAIVSDSFSSTSNAQNPWRAFTSSQGTSIVEVRDGQNELRVGLSSDAKDVKKCTQASPSESAGALESIGGISWSVFTSEKLGTDAERRIISYRTVHDSKCYALERFEGISQEPVDTGYTFKDSITSFTFAH